MTSHVAGYYPGAAALRRAQGRSGSSIGTPEEQERNFAAAQQMSPDDWTRGVRNYEASRLGNDADSMKNAIYTAPRAHNYPLLNAELLGITQNPLPRKIPHY